MVPGDNLLPALGVAHLLPTAVRLGGGRWPVSPTLRNAIPVTLVEGTGALCQGVFGSQKCSTYAMFNQFSDKRRLNSKGSERGSLEISAD